MAACDKIYFEERKMEKFDFTFLTTQQVFGDWAGFGQLTVFSNYGTMAAVTDAATILGAYGPTKPKQRTLKGEEKVSGWWLSSATENNNVCCVSHIGEKREGAPCRRGAAARPAARFSSIENLPNVTRGADGILRCRMGSYPQTIASRSVTQELEANKQFLKPTGRKFTFDTKDYWSRDPFSLRSVPEYEYKGKRYVRLGCKCLDDQVLSNGQVTELDRACWLEVEPIEWLVDEASHMIISERCLYAGIQFDPKRTYDGNFEKTFAKKYLDEYFSKEIGYETDLKAKEEKAVEKALSLDEQYEIEYNKIMNEFRALKAKGPITRAVADEYKKKIQHAIDAVYGKATNNNDGPTLNK